MPSYVELHAHSCFSLLDGAAQPEALVKHAFELGMSAIALTDHDAVYGAMRFVQAAKSCGVKPILGAELTLVGDYHLTLLIKSTAGWYNLCWLISQARQNAPKGQAALPAALLEGHTDGLIALSGCSKEEVSQALSHGNWKSAHDATARYRDLFGRERFWLELQCHQLPEDKRLVRKLVTLSKKLGIGYVATNNVHYLTREDHELQDILVCIRNNVPLDEAGYLLRPNSEFYFKSAAEMEKLFADLPDALSNTLAIAERCNFELHYGLQDLPQFPTSEVRPQDYLRQLCVEALPRRVAGSQAIAQKQLDHELTVIEASGLSNYFLLVWDMVRFAREQGVRCQGRGSAANSLVAYLLNISPVDPIAHNLVFERFLSDERKVAPDIDIDFAAGNDREKVIQYVYQKYGIDHAAMAATFVTFRAKSALREIGKALGFPLQIVNGAAKVLDVRDPKLIGQSAALQEFLGKQSTTLPWQQLFRLSAQIADFPRHLGIHNGGMIITGSPIAQRIPVEPATMAGRFVTQGDKEWLEDAGLIKIDILGLRMLSAIAEALRLIEASSGREIDLDALTFDDPSVYDMICRADTIGMFQVESRAQINVLPRMLPRRFEDLVISISLIRPGPIQGNMVHPYLRRRMGAEKVSYFHPHLKPSLEETLGIILFQEQVIKVAHDLAGFTPGQGEQLRRALGAKNAEEKIGRFEAIFLSGSQVKGVSRSIAEVVFGKLRAFGSYSFPKSHAVAFAVIVYQSAWLKRYYPAAFFVGLLNNQPMGFYSPAVLVNDAKRHGIRILPVRVNQSRAKCTFEEGNIRLGFEYVACMGKVHAEMVEKAQVDGLFTSLADFCRRTRLPKGIVEHLIFVGAMDEYLIERRQLLWELGTLQYEKDQLALDFNNERVVLPPLSPQEKANVERMLLGVSVGDHVMAQFGNYLAEHGILGSAALEQCSEGSEIQAAGLLVVHQAPPTAKGFHFLSIEDAAGMMNVIVKPDVYISYRRVLRESPLLLVKGRVQRDGKVVNLIAQSIDTLPVAVSA